MSIADLFPGICRICFFTALGAFPVLAQGIAQTRAMVSPIVPKYIPTRDVMEELKISCSDSLNDTAAEWDLGFRSFHRLSRVSFIPQESAVAIQGFIKGTSTLILSARDMTTEEQSTFQFKYGYAATRIPICLDAVIVFVNKGNPINEISLNQLDAIYSSTRLSGTRLTGDRWGQLGARGEWKDRSITPYSREEGATIRSWFLATVLMKGGKFKDTVQNRQDALSLAEAVVTDPKAIAFSSMDAWYSSVKVIPVAPLDGQKAEPPSQEAIYAGKYPLVRSFYMFVNKAPGKPLTVAYEEFTRYMLSSDGQNVIADTGFIPAPADFLLMGLKRLN